MILLTEDDMTSEQYISLKYLEIPRKEWPEKILIDFDLFQDMEIVMISEKETQIRFIDNVNNKGDWHYKSWDDVDNDVQAMIDAEQDIRNGLPLRKKLVLRPQPKLKLRH